TLHPQDEAVQQAAQRDAEETWHAAEQRGEQTLPQVVSPGGRLPMHVVGQPLQRPAALEGDGHQPRLPAASAVWAWPGAAGTWPRKESTVRWSPSRRSMAGVQPS